MTYKKIQWFNYGDHPAVKRPKESHLQPCPGLKNAGILETGDGGYVVVREGDWLLVSDDGRASLLRPENEDT